MPLIFYPKTFKDIQNSGLEHSEKQWLVINAEYDEVTDIELGVPVKNDEEYDWK